MAWLVLTKLSGGMQKVICVSTAKVPIVKMWDPELKLACDMNVNNTLALENTRMIKTYVQIDPRVRPLAMIVKHWTKQRLVNDAGKQDLHERFMIISLTIFSFWWNIEFIHLDMHDYLLPPESKSSDCSRFAPTTPFETPSKRWLRKHIRR